MDPPPWWQSVLERLGHFGSNPPSSLHSLSDAIAAERVKRGLPVRPTGTQSLSSRRFISQLSAHVSAREKSYPPHPASRIHGTGDGTTCGATQTIAHRHPLAAAAATYMAEGTPS